MTICACCQKPKKDEELKPIARDSASGPGDTLFVCRDYRGCKPVPSQTTPHSIRH
ncbi:hypothetical protein [Streptomyces violaceus]|uniref:Uncharacterized protein n=1 Tax=Streptomyces violaceus TaxID=1936 RepID=A0ABY9UE50_STRVL|nr:hypothetical protein [Streptomyces janthinus]WND21179.1 hypothetical protein RI060_29275 [Streptomyces janthinus]GGS47611.1 hypothetical protein GCM10010270_17080 [Streptomyces janthinus]